MWGIVRGMCGVGLGLCLAACAPGGETNSRGQELSLESERCSSTLLRWGAGTRELGYQPALPEATARGPEALAFRASGDLLLLDSLKRRVLSLGNDSTLRVLADGLPDDVNDLAVGPDDAFAVYSPLQSQVFIFDADGAPAGNLEIPRVFRHVTGISLGRSRQVTVHNAYQESMVLGSPAAPASLATALRGKREGARLLPDGTGLRLRAEQGHAELELVHSLPGSDSKARLLSTMPLPGRIDGAQLIGLVDGVACMRGEELSQPGDEIRVARRALCVDAQTGALVHEQPLAPRGTALPTHELALGGTPLQLATLEASDEGLTIRRCEVAR